LISKILTTDLADLIGLVEFPNSYGVAVCTIVIVIVPDFVPY